jgi:hypothetical protein
METSAVILLVAEAIATSLLLVIADATSLLEDVVEGHCQIK